MSLAQLVFASVLVVLVAPDLSSRDLLSRAVVCHGLVGANRRDHKALDATDCQFTVRQPALGGLPKVRDESLFLCVRTTDSWPGYLSKRRAPA